MKRLYILIFIVAGASCSDTFLDVTPNHYLTENSFYKTQDDYVQSVNAVYGDMQKYILEAHYLEEGRSDNTTYDNYLDQGSLGGQRELGYLDQFKMTSNAQAFENAWSVIFNTVKDCNLPLSYLKTADIDPELAARLEGELRFFRAYFYFVAVRYWGDVPLILTPLTTANQAFAITRAPAEDVYAAIVNDAELAESVLPASYVGKDVGRVTKGAAKMLLAKIYLTKKEYAKAEEKLRELIALNEYALLSDYADIFDPSNKNNSESIFEVQFLEGSEGESSNFIYQFAPVGANGSVIVGPGVGGGKNIPTKEMVSTYEPGDLRKDLSIGSLERDGQTVYYVKKYDHDTDENFARTPDNWPVYRYADALLMLAESINAQGYQTDEPFSLINDVRDRANLPPLKPEEVTDQESFSDALAHERRVELAFENHRWFDLVRTGKAIEVMRAYGAIEMADPTTPPPGFLQFNEESFNVQPYMLLYPIPANELNKTKNIKQNPGY